MNKLILTGSLLVTGLFSGTVFGQNGMQQSDLSEIVREAKSTVDSNTKKYIEAKIIQIKSMVIEIDKAEEKSKSLQNGKTVSLSYTLFAAIVALGLEANASSQPPMQKFFRRVLEGGIAISGAVTAYDAYEKDAELVLSKNQVIKLKKDLTLLEEELMSEIEKIVMN